MESTVDFSAIATWFDDLPEGQKQAIRELHQKSAKADAWLIPEAHGPNMTAQLETAKRKFLECPEPFCLVRIGDSELGLLGAGFLPPGTPKDMKWYRFRGGFNPASFGLRRVFIDAIRNAEMVGVQQNWKPIRESTGTTLRMLGLPVPLSNGVEVHISYKLLVDGTLFSWLAGRRVVLIGGFAGKLMEAWKTAPFHRAYKRWGPVERAAIVGAIPMPLRNDGGAATQYEAVLRKLKTMQYDVALLSCGVTAKPLAWTLRNMGKTALDIGFVFNALLGDPERHKRPVLREASWPEETWWTTK